jgi:hypothetical protein
MQAERLEGLSQGEKAYSDADSATFRVPRDATPKRGRYKVVDGTLRAALFMRVLYDGLV